MENIKDFFATKPRRVFNTEGCCLPSLNHFIVPLDDNLDFIDEPGRFTALYSHRQGAKSTRLLQYNEKLNRSSHFAVLNISFLSITCSENSNATLQQFYESLGDAIISSVNSAYKSTLKLSHPVSNQQDLFNLFRKNSLLHDAVKNRVRNYNYSVTNFNEAANPPNG